MPSAEAWRPYERNGHVFSWSAVEQNQTELWPQKGSEAAKMNELSSPLVLRLLRFFAAINEAPAISENAVEQIQENRSRFRAAAGVLSERSKPAGAEACPYIRGL